MVFHVFEKYKPDIIVHCAAISDVGLEVSRLRKNEEAFKDNPRNISMSQDKINECGIFFASTADGLARSFEKVLNNNPLSTKQ